MKDSDPDGPSYYPDSEAETPAYLTVKDFDPDDQPREKALKYGINTLTTPDLWALILRTGLRGKPITELCRDLMRSCDGSLFNLERLSHEEIMELKGIGKTKALQIEAVMELIRRYSLERVGEKVQIKTSSDIYQLMRPTIGNLDHEEIWVILMNRRHEVIDKRRISTGSATASLFDVKTILAEALKLKAQTIAMAHNHPSGTLVPSVQDNNITSKLKSACGVMDIAVIDHVIVTTNGYYSYNDRGML